MSQEIINPYTGTKVDSFSEMTPQRVRILIDDANEVQQNWKNLKISYRAGLLKKVAKILLKNKKKYARVMTIEMGKPITDAIAEVEKCAWVCNYYAANAKQFLRKQSIKTEATKSFVTFQPLGVVLAVMPWNFPFWQVFRFAAPTLIAGNAAILKHASNVPLSALNIQEIFEKAGFPKGLFSTLLVSSKAVKKIIENPKIKAVTLTGSGPAGSAVAAIAGKQIKKTVLELGGNDAYIILKDADLKKAAKSCVKSRLINSGQSCIGAKRFIVVEKIYDKFLKHFVKEMKKAIVGDPMDKKTTVGPMARFDLRDELHEQVMESIAKGAECILGGNLDQESKAAFYPPTILINVRPGMPAYEDELFGPVASIIKVKDQEEAINVANDSKFGLGSAIFTKDTKLGTYLATKKIQAGACFVNTYVSSDPRLPFGGIKQSGYGRELALEGIMEFVNTKTVYVK